MINPDTYKAKAFEGDAGAAGEEGELAGGGADPPEVIASHCSNSAWVKISTAVAGSVPFGTGSLESCSLPSSWTQVEMVHGSIAMNQLSAEIDKSCGNFRGLGSCF